MTPFAPFRRRDAVAKAVAEDIRAWHVEYLAQIERDEDLAPRSLKPFAFVAVRHSNYITPTEASRGVVAVVSINDVRNYAEDSDDRTLFADVEIGVRLAVQATRDASSDFLHRYQAVVAQLLLDFPNAGGLCNDLVPLGEDDDPFEVENEAVRMGVDMTFLATNVEVGSRRAGPPPGASPRPDPYEEPWPDAPTVDSTEIDVRPIDPEDLP